MDWQNEWRKWGWEGWVERKKRWHSSSVPVPPIILNAFFSYWLITITQKHTFTVLSPARCAKAAFSLTSSERTEPSFALLTGPLPQWPQSTCWLAIITHKWLSPVPATNAHTHTSSHTRVLLCQEPRSSHSLSVLQLLLCFARSNYH